MENKQIEKYVNARMSKGDDRQSKDKRWADAKLRGSVGVHKANKIIKHIDTMKSWR